MGVHYYIIGLVILSFGIALAVESMLGTSPFDALLVGLYRTFGLTIGSWEVVVGFVMIVGNALAERKRPEYFAFITSLITGIGIDSWLVILRLFDITNSGRSEEHTSELQSRFDIVCRLLLEKKKY